jgi:DNA replication protein DnaC
VTTALLVEAYAKELRLPAVGRHYAGLARAAEDEHRTYEEYLAAVLEQELVNRRENQLRRRMKQASFPMVKTLESFEFTALPNLNKAKVLSLAKGEFVERRESLFFIGNPGTGKTHLCIALAVALCQRGYRVRFTTAANLVDELLAAQQDHRLGRYLRQWVKYHLVIVDEVGFVPFSRSGAELLFNFFAEHYERRSVAVTSNLEFGRWTQVFGDEVLTAALLDRLTHRAHILEMNGESYRFRESIKNQQKG